MIYKNMKIICIKMGVTLLIFIPFIIYQYVFFEEFFYQGICKHQGLYSFVKSSLITKFVGGYREKIGNKSLTFRLRKK